MKIAYLRVSSTDQHTDRQEITADKTYTDKATGTNTDRPQLQEMLRSIREGDEVHVWSIDRLARSISDMHDLIQQITGAGCSVHFLKENLTFTADKSNPMNELLLNMLASVYQFETAIRKERQLEGIAKAKEKGVYEGRTTAMRQSAEVLKLLEEGMSQRKIAEQVDISLSSVQRIVKKHKQ
ncbi:recombinase family protein [Vibrio methylphosphonaticus]|uniref:recombinase family protein n=1 Tax=Vibrio methylphosphonaticus TaxID=2946866 RepID=UPI00202A5BF3|nr:recombinase family protein [Vibrio methylphosphonaticus]MCL9773575.1 recombinase family protein [Vibrio methylphosphonaticus]